jgi:hypothetical protein
MEIQQLKKEYDFLLKNEDFDKLDLGLKNPNIFQILKISKNEIRHSNFLSWLLDPEGSHKLGDIFLKRFLREVFSSDKFFDIDQVDVEGMDLSKVEVLREWKNIDVLIILSDVVVCIENKVYSKEHSNQLKRYKEIIENQFPKHKKTYVYLNPDGDSSESETEQFQPISYDFIVESLERIVSVFGESMNPNVKNYIKDYTTTIKREIMGTDQLTELSKKIYQNHKELFDFIFEHKPDIVDNLNLIMKDELNKRGWLLGSENKYYIRFLTEPIKDLVYYNTDTKNGWNKRESFLFEIQIQPSTNKLIFKTVISPSDSKYNVERLQDILLEIDGFRKPYGQKWLVNYDKKEKFIYDDVETNSEEELRKSINDFYDKIIPIINKVENKLVENSNELMKMKLLQSEFTNFK